MCFDNADVVNDKPSGRGQGEGSAGLIVPKEKIAANGDYNLSGERYREGDVRSSNYPTVPIAEICDLINGRAFKPEDWQHAGSGGLPIVRIQNLNTPDSDFNYYTGEVRDRFIVNEGELLFSWSGSRGTSFGAHIWKGGKAILNQHIFKVGFDLSRATKMYLLHALNRAVVEVEENLHGGVGLVHITKGNLEKIKIPLPPLEVQKEIVGEIEGYQKVINGARAVLDHYRPHIPIHPDWPMVELGKIARLINGRAYKQEELLSEGPTPVLRVGNFFSNRDWYYSDLQLDEDKYCNAGDLLYAWSASFGPRIWEGPRAIYHYHIWKVETTDAIDKRFLLQLLEADSEKIKSEGHGIAMMHATKGGMEVRKFPVPPLATQRAIIGEIEAEQALVAANRELISRFEQKIQATLARIWGSGAEAQPG